ncbi:MAG: hypothetical protein U0414_11955 [Polyangiaceae bacterium]
MASPFRIRAEEPSSAVATEDGARAMRVEHVLVLVLTTPILVLGVWSHRSFGVALTVALFAWLFSFVSLVRSRR